MSEEIPLTHLRLSVGSAGAAAPTEAQGGDGNAGPRNVTPWSGGGPAKRAMEVERERKRLKSEKNIKRVQEADAERSQSPRRIHEAYELSESCDSCD